MSRTPRERVRNIGIVAHIDAGKTTTTERFLYYAGLSHKIGEVHDGEAVMDFRPDERERGITISDAATTLYWDDFEINLIDTPGHVDFTAEVERALRVLDGAVVVFDAVAGVEPQSETVWHQADRYGVPRIAFVNKMDRVGASFDDTLESIEGRLGATTIAISFPDGGGEDFRGIVDLVEERYLEFDSETLGKEYRAVEVPDRLRDEAARRRDAMLERIAERYDPIAEPYLEGEPIDADTIREGLRAITIERTAVPVLSGSALKNVGVQTVLDAVCAYLPSPLEVEAIDGVDPRTGEPTRREPSPDAPFSALLFKIMAKQAADLAFIRVYSGALESGGRVLNTRSGKTLRLRRFQRVHADRSKPVELVEAGDIVAIAGLADAGTGDTLCDPEAPVVLEPIRFPDTVVSIAIEPRTNADRDRLTELLHRLQREDPTLVRRVDGETGQTLLSGMGELHLEVVLDRVKRDFNIEVQAGKPRVSYRETVAGPGRAAAEYRRKIGDNDLFARVELNVVPIGEPGAAARVENDLPPGTVPQSYIPALRESVRNAADGGGLFGYPVTGIRVGLVGAEFDDAGQPEIALNSAASLSFRDVLKDAGSVVLEPYGSLEVRVPEDYLGGVVKTLNQRRALVEKTSYQRNTVIINGVAPIAEMFGYLTALRSQTQGRGAFSLEPLDYRPVPDHLVEQTHERLF